MDPMFSIISLCLIGLEHIRELLLLAAIFGIAAFLCLYGTGRK